jgi:hypothetical protein
MPEKKKKKPILTLSDDAEIRETDQLNVWCKVCGELVAEVNVVHANKPAGFNPVRRQQMLKKISDQIEAWRKEIDPTFPGGNSVQNVTNQGRLEGAQFVMRTIQGLFRDFELEKHPSLLGD